MDTQTPTVITATSPSLVAITFTASPLVVEEEGDLHLQYVYFKFVNFSQTEDVFLLIEMFVFAFASFSEDCSRW